MPLKNCCTFVACVFWSYGSFHWKTVSTVLLAAILTVCATSSPFGLKLWKPPAYRLVGTPVKLMFVPASEVLPAVAVRPVPAGTQRVSES